DRGWSNIVIPMVSELPRWCTAAPSGDWPATCFVNRARSLLKLLIQPHDGIAPLLAGIKSAKKSIDILIFRMDWKALETALEAASSRGIVVRALIAYTARNGEAKLRNLETRFLAAGVTVGRTADD